MHTHRFMAIWWVCQHETEHRLKRAVVSAKGLLHKSLKPLVTNSPLIPQSAITIALNLPSISSHYTHVSFFTTAKIRHVSFKTFSTISFLSWRRQQREKQKLFEFMFSFLIQSMPAYLVQNCIFVLNKSVIYIDLIMRQHAQ